MKIRVLLACLFLAGSASALAAPKSGSGECLHDAWETRVLEARGEKDPCVPTLFNKSTVDVTGDGVPDVVMAPNSVNQPVSELFVFDGKTGREIPQEGTRLLSRPGVNMEITPVDLLCDGKKQISVIYGGGGGHCDCRYLSIFGVVQGKLKRIFGITLSETFTDGTVDPEEANAVTFKDVDAHCPKEILSFKGKAVPKRKDAEPKAVFRYDPEKRIFR